MLIKTLLRTVGSLTVAAILLSQSTLGQDQWINPFGGFYYHPFNWQDTTAPGPGDTAVFGIDGSYTVTWNSTSGNTICRDVYVPLGDVTFRSGDATRWSHRVTNLLAINGDSSLSLGAGNATALDLNVDGEIAISNGGVMNILLGSSAFTPTSSIGDTVGDGSLNVIGQSSTLSSDSIYVGRDTNGANGFINLQDGANAISQHSRIGYVATGTGVIGNQAAWYNFGGFYVGYLGDGGLFISGGGSLETESLGVATAGSGFVSVIGENSRMRVTDGIRIGFGGDGVIEIRDEGGVEAENVDLGIHSSSGSGTVNINGSGAFLNVDEVLNVGASGEGTLNVLNGGRVDAQVTVIGTENGNGSVVVRGLESYFLTNYLDVGVDGTGSLTIEDNGLVVIHYGIMRIGQGTGSGEVILSNRTRLTSNDGIRIGSQPTSEGRLSVLGGSALTVDGDVEVAGNAIAASGGVGVFSIKGASSAEIAGTLKIWDSGRVVMCPGTFNPFLRAVTIDNSTGGIFDFQDGNLVVENFIGDLVNHGGSLSPNFSQAGPTVITGDYTQLTDGSLVMGIGGTSPGGTHDVVTVTGVASLDGQLFMMLINGFTPDPDDEFILLDAAAINGFFDNIFTGQRLNVVGGQGSFVVNYGVGSAFPNRRIVLSDFQPNVVVVEPVSFLVTRGQYVSGDESDLAASDNADLSLRRLGSDIQSRTEFEVKSTSPIANPSSFEFTLEGAVFARSNVVQTIELFDYVAAAWELVDSRNAVRPPSPDSVVTVAASGDLSRFIEPGTMCIEARVRYRSDNPRQNFASNTDHAVWTIE